MKSCLWFLPSRTFAGTFNRVNRYMYMSSSTHVCIILLDDIIKWKHFPRYWYFVVGIHRSPVNSPQKDRWCGALMFSLIYACTNDWVNIRDTGGLNRHRAHYGVTVIFVCLLYEYTAQNATMGYFNRFELLPWHNEEVTCSWPRKHMLLVYWCKLGWSRIYQ